MLQTNLVDQRGSTPCRQLGIFQLSWGTNIFIIQQGGRKQHVENWSLLYWKKVRSGTRIPLQNWFNRLMDGFQEVGEDKPTNIAEGAGGHHVGQMSIGQWGSYDEIIAKKISLVQQSGV